jgi:hypothetical protein
VGAPDTAQRHPGMAAWPAARIVAPASWRPTRLFSHGGAMQAGRRERSPDAVNFRLGGENEAAGAAVAAVVAAEEPSWPG